MPKIEIIEKDYTTPGIEDYANFSVVVPGFCGKEVAEGIFDDNGIYEVSSQEDFINNIGTVNAGPTDRVFAKAELINYKPTNVDPIDNYRRKLSGEEFYSTYKGNVYTVEKITEQGRPAANEGKDILEMSITSGNVTTYEYYDITEATSWDANTQYVVVKESNRGQDKADVVHYGNQMAYELLGLGYTVLYKDLTNKAINDDFLSPLTDKANYDFRFIVTGYIEPEASYNNAISKLANDRGDCIAICDIDESVYVGEDTATAIAAIIAEVGKTTDADKNSTFIVPSLCYKLDYPYKKGSTTEKLYTNNKFPGSFHYLACFAHSVRDLNFAEWYAAAGYTRGISKYAIESTSIKFGESAIAALEPRFQKDDLTKAVNVIANFRNNYVLWGNRTACELGLEGATNGDLVASHFLNIRQLCTTLKKELYVACRRFTFDPNSDVLWINFCNAIRPTLDAMKADQGINDYEIIKVATAQKATLKARIRIVPIEAVEDFVIELSLEDSLGDTNITITE